MGFQFDQFTQRLKWIGLKLGKKIVAVTEEYTSKTHPQTGVINSTLGGAKTIKLLDGSADRDIVGAFNILLKSLVGDTPVFITQDM
jgi:putative transposase